MKNKTFYTTIFLFVSFISADNPVSAQPPPGYGYYCPGGPEITPAADFYKNGELMNDWRAEPRPYWWPPFTTGTLVCIPSGQHEGEVVIKSCQPKLSPPFGECSNIIPVFRQVKTVVMYQHELSKEWRCCVVTTNEFAGYNCQ
ncbi:MAG: hypothetical protein PHX74_00865 [Candidatus Sumerlaeales bacterium]|nr:hypothetical protein [Candidatus Sumerlaeales bacterium]